MQSPPLITKYNIKEESDDSFQIQIAMNHEGVFSLTSSLQHFGFILH
jgi:hypothetical protein